MHDHASLARTAEALEERCRAALPEIRSAAGPDAALRAARDALLAQQHAEGYWLFEFEADCTIPAEYILMMHFMGEIEPDLQAKMAVYLRDHQMAQSGWPLYHGGDFDPSCSVKAYYALKLAGDDAHAPHMIRARAAILTHGGAARCNVFTRISLALFEQIPWRGVPFMPVELLLLPRWLPFHLGKVSYWSRTVVVPLLILAAFKPKAKNPGRVGIQELFTVPPERERRYFPVRSRLNRVFLAVDSLGRKLESLIPRRIRRRALQRAEQWMIERLNGRGGLGAIFPAMINAHEALACLGYPPEHPYRREARQALRDLLVIGEDRAYCQPCVSPVWDTGLACMALQEFDDPRSRAAVRRGLDWLAERQLLDEPGDWRDDRPLLPGGGWPFQFRNDHYPDLDDTGVIAWAMVRTRDERYRETIRRAVDWLCGMQSRNGGFASFDVDNTRYYLNEIPFADHGALLDPPTADVSARCVALLGRLARHDPRYREPLRAGLDYLRREQEASGAWFGRWGTNYIYGTWSVLAGLEQAGVEPDDPAVRLAAAWLESVQRADGGWGESNDTYQWPEQAGQGSTSTSFQTAWAMLGLMAAGRVDTPAVHRGAAYLLHTQRPDGGWWEPEFTSPGFPRVFYLKYHGYSLYFPLWALARYRKLLHEMT